MEPILTDTELRHAYTVLRECEAEAQTLYQRNIVIDLKRNIREYNRDDDKSFSSHVIWNQDNIDSFSTVTTCPKFIHDREEAEDCYHEYYEEHFRLSQYDCTGSRDTYLRAVFFRNGRWNFWYDTILDI